MSPSGRLRVPVRYDFASTLCYVAHRTLPRLADDLRELEIELDWTPLDLAGLLGWQRGERVTGRRRDNALTVAEQFDVRVRMPSCWLDSRRAMAFGLLQVDPAAAAAWRERVFSAVFEEDRPIERDDDLAPLARELGLAYEPAALESGLDELAHHTERAREAEVIGVPSFQLGAWPLVGIQSGDTMRAVLSRWASLQRR